MEGSNFYQPGGPPENPETKKSEDDDEEEENDSSSTPVRKRSLFSSLIEKGDDRASKERAKEASEEAKPGKDARDIFTKPSEEVEPVSEVEAPKGELSPEETKTITRALAEQNAEAIPEHQPEELADPVSAGDVLSKVFYEKAQVTGDIEAAANEALAETGLNPEDLPADNLAETVDQPEVEPNEEVVFDRAAELNSPSVPEDEGSLKPTTPAAAPEQTTPLPPPGPIETSGGGIPPRPPRPPVFFPMPGAGGDGFGPHRVPPMEAPAAGTAASRASSQEYLDDRANPATMALFGGIIGYLIGRRRGRIKAEKKAGKERKKLEKHVEDIQWQLRAKETAIRKMAAEHARKQTPVFVEAITAAAVAAKPNKAEKPPEPALERLHPRVPHERLGVENRKKAPEANVLHTPDRAHEHLGHMLLSAQQGSAERPANSETVRVERQLKKETVAELPEQLRTRHVETLNRTELLRLSEKIIVDGTSLRQIYETHLIGERGLRRLVDEHLHGGDIKKILREEIVEHEIDFERDPAVRDLAVPPAVSTSGSSTTSDSSSKQVLDKLVDRASKDLGGNSEAAAYYKARMEYEAKEQQEERGRRRIVDIGLTTVIVVLAVLVLVLYLSRQ